jgi:imidazolonepropionase-like amidohydrolase
MTTKRIALLILLAALACFTSSTPQAGAPAPRYRPLMIIHATLIDATGAPPQPDMTVAIERGKIALVARTGSFTPPPRATIVDASGKFLIPGLWDMHVHVAGINADPAWSKQTLLPLLIANGITGIRDMGGDLEALQSWRKEIEGGLLPGPHIVASGPMLLPPRAPKAPAEPPDPSFVRVKTAAEARETVDTLKKRGADFIKVIDLPRAAYFAAAEEAHQQGLPFVGHIPSTINATEASNAGQKSIEHVVYSSLAFDCSSREAELRKQADQAGDKGDEAAAAAINDAADASFDPAKAAALWKIFVKNGTWEDPTLFSIYANAHHAEDSPDDPLLAYLPPALRKQWTPKPPSEKSRKAAAWWQRQFQNDLKLTAEMHRAGVRLLAGSDSLDTYVFPGPSLHQELQLLVQAGLTPMEALQAATKNASDFLEREDIGVIATGKTADLVLLDADPLADISNTKKINAVVLGGKYLSRADLDAMLAQGRQAATAQQPAPK